MIWEWIKYLSDSTINDFAALVVRDYKILAMLVAGPVLWAINRWTNWTPWKSDDKIGEMIEQKLGLKE